MHQHALAGCAPAPLAHYLKAIGLLRILSAQADPGVRGFWRGDAFYLITRLSLEDLCSFLLERYAPSPLVAPWNGGSGFYPKDNRDGFDSLRLSNAPRFAIFREAIELGQAAVGTLEERPDKEDKQRFVARLRAKATEPVLDWLGAAVSIGHDRLEYPALLGTGGNDGRLDFTNNQMQWLADLFDPQTGGASDLAVKTLPAALFGDAVNGLPRNRPIGQFLPGGAGGPNATTGYEGGSMFNPWDYVLAFEGVLTLQVGAVRRLNSEELPHAAAPFAMRSQAGGYASAAAEDEGGRGEQWMPLWGAPSTAAEVQALFSEGRMALGGRTATTALAAARALARTGTARGVEAFVRYGFIVRNGLSNLAVPLGRWKVQPKPQLRLLDELDDWVDRWRSAVRSGAPAAADRALRRLEGAMFEVSERPDDPASWVELLRRAGEGEALLIARPKWTQERYLQPIPHLSSDWWSRLNDGSAEFRIAAAIASQQLGSFLGVEVTGTGRHFLRRGDRIDPGPDLAFRDGPLVTELCRLVIRATITSARHGFALNGAGVASLGDIGAFVAGALDDTKIAGLIRGLSSVRMCLDGKPPLGDLTSTSAEIVPTYALLRLAYRPARGQLAPVPIDPAPLRLLVAGRVREAVERASRRLVASGLRPRFSVALGGERSGRRLCAALAIPVSQSQLRHLERAALKRASHAEVSAQ